MRFWDSSALVPLVVGEARSGSVRGLFESDTEITVWWGTLVECSSAIARLERQGSLSPEEASEAVSRIEARARAWTTVDPTDELRELARRFVRVHPLRAADALQLAAAYLAAERRPPTLELVTLDDRLRDTAAKEGFVLVNV